MSEEKQAALDELRAFMFEHVYERANKLIQESAERMLTALFEYFVEHSFEMPPVYTALAERDGVERAVSDYLSSMTDRFAINTFKRLFVPREGSV